MNLEIYFQLIAAAQIGIAILNLFLPHILNWKADLDRLPLLLREVFQVHAWFISVTLLLFGIMTWRFASEFSAGEDEIGRWLAGGIGLFWSLRTILQMTYYSSSHWKGLVGRTVIHLVLLFLYGSFSALYLFSSLQTKSLCP